MSKTRISYLAIIIGILAFGGFLSYGVQLGYSKSAASGAPITIVQSNWYNPVTRRYGGFVGDGGDRLNLIVLNTNGFGIRYLTANITSLQPNTITNVTGGTVASSGSTSYTSVINSGNTGGLNFTVDISQNATTGPVQLSVSLSYSASLSPNATYSELTQTSVEIYARASVSLSSIATAAVFGNTSTISFGVTNNGEATVFSPSVTIKFPPSPPSLVVVGNSFVNGSSSIDPGSSEIFSFNVTTTAKTAAGAHPGDLSVTYNDQFGDVDSNTFSIGVTVIGGIDLVLQSNKIVQTLGNLTVDGTLVNYGSSPAYFTTISGTLSSTSVSGSSTSAFVGTIQPKASAYFTITIPYSPEVSAPQGVSVVLKVTYQNITGAALSTSNSTSFNLLPASQLPKSPGTEQILIIEAGIVAVVIVVGLIGLLSFRQRRLEASARKEEAPRASPKQDADTAPESS